MNLQTEFHCQKCGRRSRSHNTYINNHRGKNAQHRCRHGHLLKCKQQRIFPTEFPPYPMVPQTNDNHSMSKSGKQNILIDQLIQVQQLNDSRCNTRSYSYSNDTDNDHPIFTDTINKLKQVQQMIYLRENINNLTYRELHFPNEYVILKRLEEKNNLIQQNRFKVDHCFRSLKLQYQTISTILQNIPITSFIYSKQDPCQPELIVKTPFKRCPLSEDIEINQQISNDIAIDQSLSTVVEMNDNESSMKQNENFSIVDPTDPSVLITPYNEYTQQPYSQNATQTYLDTDRLTKSNSVFDTAVIIDVTKCPQIPTKKSDLTHHSSTHDNWSYIKPTFSNTNLTNEQITQTTWNIPFLENNQQELSPVYIPNQTIYYNQHSRFENIYPPQTMFLPCSQNSNYTYNPVSHELF